MKDFVPHRKRFQVEQRLRATYILEKKKLQRQKRIGSVDGQQNFSLMKPEMAEKGT